MQPVPEQFEGLAPDGGNLTLAVALVVGGLAVWGGTVWIVRRVLLRFGVDEAVEGTAFERAAQGIGSSTVGLVSQVCGVFLLLFGALYVVETLNVVPSRSLVFTINQFLARLFVAVLVVIVGILVGDKAEIVVGERLRSVKLPEVTVIPRLVKYSVLYIATLVALSQLRVATDALLIMLAAYAFGLFFLGGLAFKDLLSSAAAGVYLLLVEPYSIGDEVEIDGSRGIVQEMDVFVTLVESDDEEYLIPNRKVLRKGATRVRG
ncbi:mechanosensitive ion channel protein MscS [Halobacteriales archaeon QS_4_69_225]|nr:MAG: mechanosensitive ion channel protein MscS [Halobacteriales archaeon QS_4_69_225]